MIQASVLLIRVNSAVELFQTRQAVDAVRARFPEARIVTLATPQTETLPVLRQDRRIDGVLLFPPQGSDPSAKSPAAFRRFIARQGLSAVVVCYGSTHGIDYNRHILSALACPGRRYFLDPAGRIFPLMSPRGIALVRRAVAAQLMQHAGYAVLRKITGSLGRRRRPARSAPLSDALDAGRIRRVLCIRLDHIGDLVLCLPAIQALKRHAPHLEVDALVYPTSADVLAGQRDVSETLVYDAPRFSRRERKTGLRELWATVRALRRRRYDLAVDLHGDDTARLLAFLSGARYRLGPDRIDSEPPNKPNLSFLLTHSPERFFQPGEPDRHAIECAFKIVAPLGVPQIDPDSLPQPYLAVSAEARHEVDSVLETLGVGCRFAAIHAASSVPIKDWRPERFAAVADRLIDEYDLSVVLTGSPQDHALNGRIQGGAHNKARITDLSRHVPLRNLAALFARTELLVTVDTGTMHIAAAVGTPLVALFLPWFAVRFRPSNPAHDVVLPPDDAGTGSEGEASEMLLDRVTVDQVMDAVNRVRKRRGEDGGDG